MMKHVDVFEYLVEFRQANVQATTALEFTSTDIAPASTRNDFMKVLKRKDVDAGEDKALLRIGDAR